jgi:hypothetical protein
LTREQKKKSWLEGTVSEPMRQECGSACVARRATDDATPNKLQAWQLAALCGGVAATRGLCRPHNPLANPQRVMRNEYLIWLSVCLVGSVGLI